MYTVRVPNRLPQAYRVCRTAPVPYNTTRDMALFPRLIANDFAPMFRLMDDFASHVAPRGSFNSPAANIFRSFNPRFDVKETSEAYELHGELPGIDQKDIEIEFTDPQTLSIKGHTETHHEQGANLDAATTASSVGAQSEPASIADGIPQAASEAGDSVASETSSYHRPTVEDESNADADYVSVEAPDNSTAKEAETQKETTVAAPASAELQPQQTDSSSRYWVSERSVGTFQRSFAFPGRVDLDHVKASLKDGILSIVVPKAATLKSRRIDIQ